MKIVNVNGHDCALDGKGRAVPLSTIKSIDIDRDAMVERLVEKALALQRAMVEFKDAAAAEVAVFLSDVDKKYNHKPRGKKKGQENKGNMSFNSYDGSRVVQLTVAESIAFDEQLQTAKVLIDDCLKDWTSDSRDEVRALISDAFQVDKEGNISTGRVLALRRITITDKRWLNAMEAISNSVRVVGSKRYMRFYQRSSPDSALQAISLDLAAL